MPAHVNLKHLSIRLGRALLRSKRTAVTAESCTGGWVAKAITDIPGSSQWFEGALVTYSNSAKRRLLNVRPRTLERFGAVSEAVVREMATGALRHASAQLAVAVSGIAGPDGGTPDKPVGLVWFCWAVRRGRRIRLTTRRRQYRGNRNDVRVQSVGEALRGLLKIAKG